MSEKKEFDEINEMIDEEVASNPEDNIETDVDNTVQSNKEKNTETDAKEDVEVAVEEEKCTDGDIEIEWVEYDEKTIKNKKSKKNKISLYNIVRYIVMLFALVVFGYASYELTLIYVESKEAGDIKSEASDMFLVDIDSLIQNSEPVTNASGETIDLVNQGDGKIFVFDYAKMLEYNSHSKGYIRQDNGEYIDNPILQAGDNDYYLEHLANHRKSTIGSIFIDCNIADGLEAKNCIIYGHNIGDRAGRIMFGSLNWYWNTTGYYKEHPTFDIWVGDTHYRYYVFAIYKTEAAGSPVYTYAFNSDEEFMAYVNECKSRSKYTFSEAPEITKDSKIITLSTCTHTDEMRMIVQLVRGEEIDIYGNVVGN